MTTMLRVAPVPGRSMRREDSPRGAVISAPCEVPNTAYYRRALTRGDLAPWDPAAAIDTDAASPTPVLALSTPDEE